MLSNLSAGAGYRRSSGSTIEPLADNRSTADVLSVEGPARTQAQGSFPKRSWKQAPYFNRFPHSLERYRYRAAPWCHLKFP